MEVKARIRNERIEAMIPYANGEGPVLAKSIEGYRWNNEDKIWSYPLSWATARNLRRVANELDMELAMSKALLAWGYAEKKRREQQATKTGKTPELSVIKREYPEIFNAVSGRPFQAVGIDFGITVRRYLLADDPGLGKTLQTIGIMIEAEVSGPILVVANKSAANISWPNEIRKWAPNDEIVQFGAHIPKSERDATIAEVFDRDYKLGERTWVIMNPHWVRMKAELDNYGKFVYERGGVKIVKAEVPELFLHDWEAIVADESHETVATNTLNAKKWSQQRQGLSALSLRDNGFKISISGTPMRGKPENMFGHLQWLYPETYKGFWAWAKKNFEVESSDYSDHVIGQLKDPKSFYEDIADVMLRREKSEVASDLPPKQYGGTPHPDGDVVGVWLPMEKTQAKQYENFVNAQEVVDENGITLGAIGILAVYTRMKQLASSCARVGTRQVKVPMIDGEGNQVRDAQGKKMYEMDGDEYLWMDEQYLIPQLPSNKYDWLTEWLMERDLLGKNAKGAGKVIIASQFRQVLDMFREDLGNTGTPSFAITGETSAKARVDQQDRFQNDPNSPKLFFLQTVAGGTSLTLDMADDVIILDELWDPDKQLQVEDRAHRLSRKHNVTVWYPRSLGSIEEAIGTTVAEREKITRAILDGSRGVSVRKQLLGK